MKKIVLIGVGIIALGGILLWLSRDSTIMNSPALILQTSPTSTHQEPYEDLTVPFLRSWVYQSTLGEQSLYRTYSNYSSYLTSYNSDGLNIEGLLTIPNTEIPPSGFPAIVFIHGYIPPKQYKTTEKYEDYVDYLAKNGFVVFKIDLRGHGTSEGEATGAYFSSGYVIDALNAYAALQTSPNVNPDKIGLWGHSMAGNIVMRSLAVKPEIPAAVIWAGAVYSYEDMQLYGISDSSYVPPLTRSPSRASRQRLSETMGNPSLTNPFWSRVSPVSYLVDLQGAVQIHHAINDEVVSIEYSRDLVARANTSGADIQLVEHSSGGHNISGSAFVTAMGQTVAFFQKHLQ